MFSELMASLLAPDVQAKTTKKIVLRLQCSVCKTVAMKAIKVRPPKKAWPCGWGGGKRKGSRNAFPRDGLHGLQPPGSPRAGKPDACPCPLRKRSAASTSRSVATRRASPALCTKSVLSVLARGGLLGAADGAAGPSRAGRWLPRW
mmetsp:Transcript_47449/g.151998  ORF Transcript_47449/g.151998 Transcript_47449/m.151998 type:complete len:146 (-) Transcript_47449:26-463(-)